MLKRNSAQRWQLPNRSNVKIHMHPSSMMLRMSSRVELTRPLLEIWSTLEELVIVI